MQNSRFSGKHLQGWFLMTLEKGNFGYNPTFRGYIIPIFTVRDPPCKIC